MMGKGFLANKFLKGLVILPALLAFLAGVSGTAFAAEIRAVRIAATETGTRVVLDLSAPVKHKAFLLDDPGRVVLDVQRASLKGKRLGLMRFASGFGTDAALNQALAVLRAQGAEIVEIKEMGGAKERPKQLEVLLTEF